MALLLGAVLGAAGCSSSGKPAPPTPTGKVTVKSGNKVVCVITLNKNGTGTCKVSTAGYTAGEVTYTGTYNGGARFTPGTASVQLTIVAPKPAGPVASSAGSAST